MTISLYRVTEAAHTRNTKLQNSHYHNITSPDVLAKLLACSPVLEGNACSPPPPSPPHRVAGSSHALTCTHMHSHALTCTHMHSHALTCTHMHSHALTCTHMHSHALTCTHMHSHALTCTHMLAKYIHLHQARINIARTAQAPPPPPRQIFV